MTIAIERCRREIAVIEAELLVGNRDVDLVLSDWWVELRIIEAEQRQEKPPSSHRPKVLGAPWIILCCRASYI